MSLSWNLLNRQEPFAEFGMAELYSYDGLKGLQGHGRARTTTSRPINVRGQPLQSVGPQLCSRKARSRRNAKNACVYVDNRLSFHL